MAKINLFNSVVYLIYLIGICSTNSAQQNDDNNITKLRDDWFAINGNAMDICHVPSTSAGFVFKVCN